MTPTALSLRYLRRAGYLVDVAERWIPGANIRRDLFHVIDLVAIKPGEIIGVQTTSLANVPARIAKAKASAELAVWLQAGARFLVHGWTMHKGLHVPKVVEILAGDVTPVVIARPPRKRASRWHTADLFAASVN